MIIGVTALLAMNVFSIGEINAATHELEKLDIQVFINEDGKIVAKSNQPLDKGNYVTILTKFPNSHFRTNDVLDQTFDDVKEQALRVVIIMRDTLFLNL